MSSHKKLILFPIYQVGIRGTLLLQQLFTRKRGLFEKPNELLPTYYTYYNRKTEL